MYLRPIRSKKAKISVEYMIAIAIGVVLLFVIGYYVVWDKIGKTTAAAVPKCSDNFNKCACFFTTGTCPSAYVSKEYSSDKCPNDGIKCTEENYLPELKKTAKDKYGTCCVGRAEKVAASRFNDPKSVPS